jgi:N-acetylmuramoyl-L-alanine amidase
MQMTSYLKTVLLATLALSSIAPAQAATLFSQREVDSNKFIAVASPYGGGRAHQLLVIEQLANSRQCWSERAGSPTIVTPLLLQFDFSGICGRSIDSNGYSIRMAGQDLGWRYSLRVQQRGNDLVLVGVPTDRKSPELLIGRTSGLTSDFAKFSFYPGWRLTKRAYNGQALGHVYLTNDSPITSIVAAAPKPPSLPISQPPRPSIPIAVPRPESSSVGSPLPKPPASRGVMPQLNPGSFVVPTIEINR